MKRIILVFSLLFFNKSFAQEKISFPSIDGLPVTANYYKGLKTRPVILLCHQANYSRGEYVNIAKVLQKLGYTCLAIDQRSGDAVNSVSNETKAAAKQKKLATNFLDAQQDMEAAIAYLSNRFQKKIIVLGSSYSASLAIKLAVDNNKIARVIAFSPGNYFENKFVLEDVVQSIKIPVWVTSSKVEAEEVKKNLATANPKFVKQFVPEQSGEHGAKVLWTGDEKTNEYWKAMLQFLKTP